MFIIIIFIFLGIGIGYAVRGRQRLQKHLPAISSWIGKATTWLIWLLLFMLGTEVGSNNRIIKALPTLGLEALVLSACGIVGSCLMAWTLWKWTKHREEGGKRNER